MSIVTECQRFVAIDDQIKDLETQVKRLKDDKAELEAEIMAAFAEEGTKSIKLTDGRSVGLHRQIWASAVDQDKLCHALAECGAGELVKTAVNTQSLSSWVREHERDNEAKGATAPVLEADVAGQFELPEEVVGLIKITEKFSIRARR